MWTVPNCITLFRVILIPVFVVVYFLDWRWAHEAGAFIFWLAAITDWFDGYLARKLQQSTPFGAFLDPVADKLIVGAALLMITHSYANLWITLPSIALLVREIYVSALREWMGSNGVRDAVISLTGLVNSIKPPHFDEEFTKSKYKYQDKAIIENIDTDLFNEIIEQLLAYSWV
ncbi:MAG: hypothetical protein Altm1KO_10510 [Alteromonas macleodii]